MNTQKRHILRVPLALSLAIFVMASFVCAFPSSTYASPNFRVVSASSKLKKSITKARFLVVPNTSGTFRLTIVDSKGRFVKSYSTRAKKNRPVALTWSGRVASENGIGKPSNDYVNSGTYRAQLTLTASSTYKTTKKVVVTANKAPRFSGVAVTSSLTPSAHKGAHVLKASYRINHKNDVVMRIIDKKTGAIVAEKKYRDVSSNKTHYSYWDGQVTKAGSVRLPNGQKALSGDVAPAGSYTFMLKSLDKVTQRTLTIKPTPVDKVSLSVPSKTMKYGSKQKLSAAVTPRGVISNQVTWKSSNTALAKVSSTGEVTAQKSKEGKVKITAQSVLTPSESSSVDISILSPSTLKASGFAVTKWCQHKASKTLLGSVTSNTPIKWVKLSILNSSGKTELTKTVYAGDSRYKSASKSFSIKSSMDAYISFAKLTPGKKSIVLSACDAQTTRTLYTQTFWVIGPTHYQSFWSDRKSTWVYPLDVYHRGNISSFGSYRSGGTRAHAAIDLIEPAGTKVYAMTNGTVERISVGTYYEGTGAVQVKNSDGSVNWYCEVKAAKGLKVGDEVKQNQVIATIQRNNYGTAMLHLEAYSGKAKGSLYSSTNTTYDNVTSVRYLRRRDLISPMGVLDLKVPATRTVAK